MRLFEVEDRFVNDLVMIIRNMVGRSDDQSEQAPLVLTYPAINRLLTNLGYTGINADILKKLYDNNDDVQKLVQDPAESGRDEIVAKTANEREKIQLTKTPGPNIDQMAKQGVNAYQKDLS